MDEYLRETYFFDYTHTVIQKLVEPFRNRSAQDQISDLFQKTRDSWRYNPYVVSMDPEFYRASIIAAQPEGHCIDKSILYIAGLRALGIPARLRLAKVVNHVAVERLTEQLGSHHIAPHGITEVFFKDQWVKASNAFNRSLCDKYQVDPLQFDGTQDAVFQAFNRHQKQFMEYVEDYGAFEDVPVHFIVDTFRKNYPKLKLPERGKQRIAL